MKFYIHTYTCFLTCSHLYVKGRILRDAPIESKLGDGPILSLIRTAFRSMSREISDVEVSLLIDDLSYTTKTDKEGYFEFYENIEAHSLVSSIVSLTATKSKHIIQSEVSVKNLEIEGGHGIISDIDDTIMVTGVKSFFKLRLIFNTLFLNPFRRKPIESAALAYQAISNRDNNNGPIIYLSNSPWNIYEYLKSFLEHNHFPIGIVMLRDMGIHLFQKRMIIEYNKYKEIVKMLNAFSSTSFILIGDTGEKDFDIYVEVQKNYPERVLKIILNDAGNSKKRKIIDRYNEDNSNQMKVEVVNGFSSYS